MKPFALLRGRRLVVLALVVAQAAFALGLSWVLCRPLAAHLGSHPDGAFVLWSEGGRPLLDLLLQDRAAFLGPAWFAAALVLLWMLAGVLLGGVLPALCVAQVAPPLHRAASYSLRRAPTLLGLAGIAVLGHGLALLTAWFGHEYGARRAALIANERSGDLLLAVYAVLPALVIVGLVAAWHDVARVQAVAEGSGVGGAAVSALRRMIRSPLGTLGAGLGFWMLGGLGVLLALGAAEVWGGRPGLALVVLVLVQQCAVAWRTVCRVWWFAHLGTRWRGQPAPATSS